MPLDELRDAYGDLSETIRAPDGVRCRGLLQDGTPVDVVALAPALSAIVTDATRFFETLERASVVRHTALASPLFWGRGRLGTLHVAYGRVAAEPLESPASTTSVAAAGVELLDALATVHAAGLSHGAITPRRIVRGRRGALLTEFGILPALLAGGVNAGRATQLCSEPPYLSPEAQGGAVPDEQSDIFAMGAVLYEVLTGKPPFGGRTTSYVLASVLADEDDGAGATETANPVVDALLRAIERQPEDRWPSARAFSQALAAGMPRAADTARAAPATGKRGCAPVAAAAIGVAVMLRLLA